MPDRPSDPTAFRLFNEIGIIDQLLDAALRKVLPHPLNPTTFGILNHFVRLGDGKTPSDLANAFQITRPSMTTALAKLEQAGLVSIEPDPEDGRTKRVFITDEGRAARADAVAQTSAMFAEIAPGLSGLDLERIADELGAIRAVLDRARD